MTSFLRMFALSVTLTASACSGSVALAPGGTAGPGQSAAPGTSLVPGTTTVVTSNKTVKDVRVSPDNFVLTAGDAKDLIATVSYTDGTFDNNVTWSSSDSRILDVNPTTGKLQAKAEGLATVVVSALTDPGRKANVTVTVRKGAVTEALTRVEPKEAKLATGETVQLNASIQMSDGSLSPNVRWESSSQAIAVVSGSGLVTGVGAGTATITAIASGDATRKATSKITVE